MIREIIGCMLIGLGIVVFVWMLYLNSVNPNTPEIYSEGDMLQFMWSNYKREYIEEGTGRTIDRQQNNITTSEGIAYTMMRAVWVDDKATFDQSFNWANNNLRRPNDALYSWLYGKKSDNTYGVLTDRGGFNSASDGDTDIAMALVFASVRFSDETYLEAAKKIMADIWELDVVTINGVPYLAANDIERLSAEKVIINPSYFSPAAYKIFAKYDPTHPWLELVDSSYNLLTKVTQEPLDTPTSAAIPPDWITLDRTTGEIIPNQTSNLTTNFSYEALRVPWRIALDHTWFNTDQSKIYLSRLGFLNSEWESKQSLASVYGHDGRRLTEAEVPAMYAGTLGYFMVINPTAAADIYNSKLLFLYDPDSNDWKSRLGYYDDNLVWFAIALYNNRLPNLDQTYD